MAVDAHTEPGPLHAVPTAPTRAELLAGRLSDPKVAASLDVILDHVDLLAVMVEGLDGFVRRGDTISDSLAEAVGDLRTAAGSTRLPWEGLDLPALLGSLREVAAAVPAATPGIKALLASPLTDPRTVGVVGDLVAAAVEGIAANAGGKGPNGVIGIARALRDPDVSRTVGFLLHAARAFGRRLDQKGLPG